MTHDPVVAIAGVTGAVGAEFIATMDRRAFPVRKLKALASARSAGKTIDFRGQKLLDIFVTLAMLAAGNIRVGEFIYQHDCGMTREDGIDVHFVKKCAFVLDLLARNGLHLLGKLFDAFASMSFNETDGYILAAAVPAQRFT